MGKNCENVYSENSKRIVLILKLRENFDFDLQKTPFYELLGRSFVNGGDYECGNFYEIDDDDDNDRTWVIHANFSNARNFRVYSQTFLRELMNFNDDDNKLGLFGVNEKGEQIKMDRFVYKVVGADDNYKGYFVGDLLLTKKRIHEKTAEQLRINVTTHHDLPDNKFKIKIGLKNKELISAIIPKKDADLSWQTLPINVWKGGISEDIGYKPSQNELAAKTARVADYFNIMLTFDLRNFLDLIIPLKNWMHDLVYTTAEVGANYTKGFISEDETYFLIEMGFSSQAKRDKLINNIVKLGENAGYSNVPQFVDLLVEEDAWSFNPEYKYKGSENLKGLILQFWAVMQATDPNYDEKSKTLSGDNINSGVIAGFTNEKQKVLKLDDSISIEGNLTTELIFLHVDGKRLISYNDPFGMAIAGVKTVISGKSRSIIMLPGLPIIVSLKAYKTAGGLQY